MDKQQQNPRQPAGGGGWGGRALRVSGQVVAALVVASGCPARSLTRCVVLGKLLNLRACFLTYKMEMLKVVPASSGGCKDRTHRYRPSAQKSAWHVRGTEMLTLPTMYYHFPKGHISCHGAHGNSEASEGRKRVGVGGQRWAGPELGTRAEALKSVHRGRVSGCKEGHGSGTCSPCQAGSPSKDILIL